MIHILYLAAGQSRRYGSNKLLERYRGGKAVMRRHPEGHIDVPCDPAELDDVDVRTDL